MFGRKTKAPPPCGPMEKETWIHPKFVSDRVLKELERMYDVSLPDRPREADPNRSYIHAFSNRAELLEALCAVAQYHYEHDMRIRDRLRRTIHGDEVLTLFRAWLSALLHDEVLCQPIPLAWIYRKTVPRS